MSEVIGLEIWSKWFDLLPREKKKWAYYGHSRTAGQLWAFLYQWLQISDNSSVQDCMSFF